MPTRIADSAARIGLTKSSCHLLIFFFFFIHTVEKNEKNEKKSAHSLTHPFFRSVATSSVCCFFHASAVCGPQSSPMVSAGKYNWKTVSLSLEG